MYKVLWERLASGEVRARLARDRSISVQAENLNAALDALHGSIIRRWGDGEPQFKLEPPLTIDDQLSRFRRFIRLFPDVFAVVNLKSADAFSDPPCERCGSLRGRRTDAQLAIEQFSDSPPDCVQLIGFGELGGVVFGEVAISEHASKRMPAEFLSGFELRPLRPPPRTRKTWFELIPKVALPQVLWTGTKYVSPRSCRSCGAILSGFSQKGEGVPSAPVLSADFVRESELPATAPTSFAVYRGHSYTVAVDEDWWSGARYARHLRKLWDDCWIVAVPDHQARVPKRSPTSPHPWAQV